MTKPLAGLIISSSMLLNACNSFADAKYSCPQKISVAWEVTTPPKGWQVLGGNKNAKVDHYLVSSTFSYGAPEEGGFLRPAKVEKSKDEGQDMDIEIYDFSSMTNQGIWLVCTYGNTPAMVSKKLPKTIKSCQVTLPRDLTNQTVLCR